MIALVALVRTGVNGMDLLEVFFQWMVQPLQARARLMWRYEGPNDPTRIHPEDLGVEEIENKHKANTLVCSNPRGTRLVPPFSEENPPNEAFMTLISSVPTVDHTPIDVASDTEHPESSGVDDDNDEEEGFKESDNNDNTGTR
ncbi:hypothetical protein D1007_59799 [Hordeum vulgare]|nr:hypothetical protein D1007_59799 [Hordeum vulgare]